MPATDAAIAYNLITDVAQVTDEVAAEYVRDAHQDYMNGGRKYNDFLESLYGKLNKYGLSDRQVAAVAKFIVGDNERAAKRAAENADASPVLVGTGITVTGEIVSAKWRISDYGESLKIVVKDDRGFKVWGTCPRAIADTVGSDDVESLKGQRIEFVAEISASDDDPCFGFHKRPKDARFLSRVA